MTKYTKAIQGLHEVTSAHESYWLLKAKVELSVFSRKHIEPLEKDPEQPRVNPTETVTSFNVTKKEGGKKHNDRT